MEIQTPLIEVLLKNKDKILKSEKYDEREFDVIIKTLKQAEIQRQTILNKIKEMGEVNVEKLKEDLGISERILVLNVEYLKELGLLEFIGEISKFYQKIEKKNEIAGLFPNVSVISERKICSGCGLCVSICPVNAIVFIKNKLQLDDETCIDCGLCYSCCPRSFYPKELEDNHEFDGEDIKFRKEFNYYKKLLTARTNIESLKDITQDGGIVTTLLKLAFEQKMINAALVVAESDNPHEPLPLLVQNEVDLLKSAGTRYAQAHALNILHEFKKFDKIAIVGTPCTFQALKKAEFYPLNKPFFNNIEYKIGLFCMESFDYDNIVKILKDEFQKSPGDVKKMNIDKGRFIIFDKNWNSNSVSLRRVKQYARYGCFICGDLTANLADISVGSISSDPGWSTVIKRTRKGYELCEKALNFTLIECIEIEEDTKEFDLLSRIARFKMKHYKKIARQKMIEQDPKERINNFQEVPKGLSEEMVKLETRRCLQCSNPLCVSGCPVNIDIPKFIKLLREEKFKDAILHMKYFNLLPGICGRVCPQETQCESVCLLSNVDDPVAIGYLERFITDWERDNKLKECPDCEAPKNIKVAVIGSGPANLTYAGTLAMKGYDVSIFEAFHAGGGVLVYGIPEFRLPKDIVKEEIETLKMLNVKVNYNSIIGKTLTIDDLKEMGFKAFFIGVGAGLPMFLRVPGLNLNGVLTANEFLTRSNLMKAYRFPEYDTPIKVGKIVTVIGGGNVAMDSARTALRLGAEKVMIVYRRSEKEMPARREEYHHGREEGIDFQFLTNPVRFIGDENENIKKMEVIKMRLGEPDASGRRRPIPIENSEYMIDTDTVIIAVGALANPVLTKSIPELKLNKRGYIETHDDGQTNLENIFAKEDIVTGSATVISAMGAGKVAAAAIAKYLEEKY